MQPQDSAAIQSDELLFDEEVLFAAETESVPIRETWKVLIVDDDTEVHEVTKLALTDFVLEEKSLFFISAYSGQEAKQLLQAHPDTAIVLLDVVMETEHAGLDIVQYIREELGNQLIRLILRTGQPGQAPEKAVVVNYGIDAYTTKTELTSQKLFIAVVTALRAFSTMKQMLESSHQLEQTLQELRHTQTQLVQAEKMSSLGQLVAGIAHEINNPINFIAGNLAHASDYTQELLKLVELYQLHCPTNHPHILQKIKEIDLDFLSQDLPKVLQSMQTGSQRIQEIVSSLRIFSRLDEAEVKAVDIHEGIDSTLMILQNRLKAKLGYPGIKVIKHYGQLPLIECYAGQLNQVFMNILSNAIDALDEFSSQRSLNGSGQSSATIAIATEQLQEHSIQIRIADNGPGMSQQVQQRLFEPFFTTKPIGKGTGLGLSISYQVVVEKHGGTLTFHSDLGKGTQFVIDLPLVLNR